MNVRPRCYEWLPLCTQQLRLRNLQAIHALNIDHPTLLAMARDHKIVLYYSLHHQLNTEAFYSSDHLPYRVHLNYKWPEIQSMDLLKSNARCVCIKIWARCRMQETTQAPENHQAVSVQPETEHQRLNSDDVHGHVPPNNHLTSNK